MDILQCDSIQVFRFLYEIIYYFVCGQLKYNNWFVAELILFLISSKPFYLKKEETYSSTYKKINPIIDEDSFNLSTAMVYKFVNVIGLMLVSHD